jgi:hypothetical protein
MKRRSSAGGERIKGKRRETPEPKTRNVPKATVRPGLIEVVKHGAVSNGAQLFVFQWLT